MKTKSFANVDVLVCSLSVFFFNTILHRSIREASYFKKLYSRCGERGKEVTYGQCDRQAKYAVRQLLKKRPKCAYLGARCAG